ncbi:uncharacterized protein LOC131255317 [Magnolia sinica]|uniref:uncharacterized protein LOC131255317 n=1 Tax=Magnolia sinica TaxID=86752 RepID=UPI002657E192|nr:uncharacterized protein LOC131255317 [Magnolia sinica]
MEIKDERFIQWPNKLRGNPDRRSKNKYCHFHWYYKHNTSDCYHLQYKIERLIEEGHLGQHIDQKENRASATEEQPIDNKPTGEIRTIFGGHKGRGDSNNAWKAHARCIRRPEVKIMILARPSKERKLDGYSVIFTDEDARGVHHPHDDTLSLRTIKDIQRLTEEWLFSIVLYLRPPISVFPSSAVEGVAACRLERRV